MGFMGCQNSALKLFHAVCSFPREITNFRTLVSCFTLSFLYFQFPGPGHLLHFMKQSLE